MKKLIEKLGSVIEGGRLEEGGEARVNAEALDMDAAASLAALNDLLAEESETEKTIIALRDTDYRDKDAFFKMTQLLKGLATAVDEDETAKKFMSAVSDALTTAAKGVLGEDVEELDEMEVHHTSVKKGDIFFYRGKPAQIVKTGLKGMYGNDSVELVLLKPESQRIKTDLGLDPQFEGPLVRWQSKRPSLAKAMWGKE